MYWVLPEPFLKSSLNGFCSLSILHESPQQIFTFSEILCRLLVIQTQLRVFVGFKSASHVSTFPLFQKLPQDKLSRWSQRGGVSAAKLLDISNSTLDTRFTVAALLRVGCVAISKMEKHIVPPAVRGAVSSWMQGTSDSKRQSCCCHRLQVGDLTKKGQDRHN